MKRGRLPKKLPDKNHPYINEFMSIIYNCNINDWVELHERYFSIDDLVASDAIEKIEKRGVCEKFKKIFVISEFQKLRTTDIKPIDLITMLRTLASKYNYELCTFMNVKRGHRYCLFPLGLEKHLDEEKDTVQDKDTV